MKDILPAGLIVSCQALKEEPLYGGDTIPKMAEAARQGGAVGIRANTVRDVNAIAKRLGGKLPIIGLIKRNYADSPVYITPTFKEVRALIRSACDVIALDATLRPRPNGVTLEELVEYLRAHTDKAIMADIATYEEAANAEKLGFDYVSTTMRSYTEETKDIHIPDFDFCKRLVEDIKQSTVIAEGGVSSFMDLKRVLDVGVERVIIGGAITRPQNITSHFVQVFLENPVFMGKERK